MSFTLSISHQTKLISRVIRVQSQELSLGAFARCSWYRCSKTRNWSATSLFFVKR